MARMALTVAGAAVVLAGCLGFDARSAQHQLQQDQSSGHQIATVLTARDARMLAARVTTGGTATVVMSGREHALVFAAAGLRALPRSRCYELWLMAPGRDHPAAMLPDPRRRMTGPVLATGLQPHDRARRRVIPPHVASHPPCGALISWSGSDLGTRVPGRRKTRLG